MVEKHRPEAALSLLSHFPVGLPSSAAGEWWDLVGRCHQESGRFREARQAYRKAERSFVRATDRGAIGEVRLRLGDVSRQLELFHDATRWYRFAETGVDSKLHHQIVSDARLGRAMALRGLGRYPAALTLFRALLRSYQRRGDLSGRAYALWAMGTTQRFAGDLRGASKNLAAAISVYTRLKDDRSLAYARCGLGGTLRMLGRPAQSRSLYALGNRFFVKTGDSFGVSYASCGQGNALRLEGQLSAALPFMNRAIRGYRRLRLHGPLGFVLWSRAQVRIISGKWSAAARDLSASERVFRRANDPRGLAYVELGRGELLRAQGKDAGRAYRAARRMASRLGLKLEVLHARFRLGEVSSQAYARSGVRIPAYLQFTTLP